MITKIYILIFSGIAFLRYLHYRKKQNAFIEEVKITNSIIPDVPTQNFLAGKWLAIRSLDQRKIAKDLGLKKPTACNWEMGIQGINSTERFFISPPIRKWTLVFCPDLPNLPITGNYAFLKSYLNRLSRLHGEVQYFTLQQTVGLVGWFRSIEGNTDRMYAYLAERMEILVDEGVQTLVEKQMSIPLQDRPLGDSDEDFIFIDADDLCGIASAWSVDTSRLAEMHQLEPGLGLAGLMFKNE